jgi:hypothetical protein
MCLELLDKYSMLWRLDLMRPMGAGRVRYPLQNQARRLRSQDHIRRIAKNSMTSP